MPSVCEGPLKVLPAAQVGIEFAPPMFTFADPDNNLLVLIEEGSKSSGTDVSKPSQPTRRVLFHPSAPARITAA